MNAPRYAIGQQFIPLSSNAHCVYTVIDILQTFNSPCQLQRGASHWQWVAANVGAASKAGTTGMR